MLGFSLSCMALFYFGLALPIARSNSVKTIFPNTTSHELAAAMFTIGHTWYITIYVIYVLCLSEKPDMHIIATSKISLTYFVFDTLYLLWRDGINIVQNKYFGHHIISISFAKSGVNGLFIPLGSHIIYWYGLIEGSNLLLKIWELSKYNQPKLYARITPYFVSSYIICRAFAVSSATLSIWHNIPYTTSIIDTIYIMGFIGIVNMFSVWFSYRIAKMLLRNYRFFTIQI